MYYEARNHESLPVADAAAAVNLIHTGKCSIYQCPTWKNRNGHRVALVDDGHIDAAFSEVAVINLDTHEKYESLTFAFCRSEAQKLAIVKECEDGTSVIAKDIVFPIDNQGKDQAASFTCGCCGTAFTSTVNEQQAWDQDAGYGICPDCVKYHAVVA